MCGKIYATWCLGMSCLCLILPGSASAQTMLRLCFTITRNSMQTAYQPKITTLERLEYIAPDGRTRTETIDPRTHEVLSVQIQNESRDLLIELDPATKTAEEHFNVQANIRAGRPVIGTFTPVQAKKQDLGTVVIDGFTCQRYRDTVGTSTVEFSACKDPKTGANFFGDIVGAGPIMQLPNGWAYSGEWHQTLVKVTRDVPMEPSFFEVPAGYQINQN